MDMLWAASMWVIRWCAGALDRFFGSPWGCGERGLSVVTGGRMAITDMLRPEAERCSSPLRKARGARGGGGGAGRGNSSERAVS